MNQADANCAKCLAQEEDAAEAHLCHGQHYDVRTGGSHCVHRGTRDANPATLEKTLLIPVLVLLDARLRKSGATSAG